MLTIKLLLFNSLKFKNDYNLIIIIFKFILFIFIFKFSLLLNINYNKKKTWSGISIIVFSILIENDYIHLALYCFGFEFIICYIIMWFFTNQLKLTSQKQILNFSPVQNNDDYFSSEDISASVEMNRRFF